MISKPITMSVRITKVEYLGLMSLCKKWKVSRQDLLHALIIDALIDEGVDVVQRLESQGCKDSTEASESCRAAT